MSVRTQLHDLVRRVTDLAASVWIEVLHPEIGIILSDTLNNVQRIRLDIDSGSELDEPLIEVETH